MDYHLGTYKHFDILVLINNFYYADAWNYNIRASESELSLINQLLEEFFIEISYYQNIENILESLLNLIGQLLFYQPFFDGNHRILMHFFRAFMSSLNYEIVLTSPQENLIPLFYNENNQCSSKQLTLILERIKKKPVATNS